jgi:hypothetical protein
MPTIKMLDVFQAIEAAFPKLRMTIESDHAEVDLNVDIRSQPGLCFNVNLNQQGDELHLSAGMFWLEWFPCTVPEVVEHYRDAVEGLLSGRYRIVEYRIGRIPVRAELQQPRDDGWVMIGGTGHWGAIIPWPRTRTILQNAG